MCCVRVSHALAAGGGPISIPSDYADSAGNRGIIKVATMKSYLRSKYGAPVPAAGPAGKKGVIAFDVAFSDATGHADLWDGSSCAYKSYWGDMSAAYIWEF